MHISIENSAKRFSHLRGSNRLVSLFFWRNLCLSLCMRRRLYSRMLAIRERDRTECHRVPLIQLIRDAPQRSHDVLAGMSHLPHTGYFVPQGKGFTQKTLTEKALPARPTFPRNFGVSEGVNSGTARSFVSRPYYLIMRTIRIHSRAPYRCNAHFQCW